MAQSVDPTQPREACPTAHEIPGVAQYENRKGPWLGAVTFAACADRRGDRVKRRDFITLLGGAAAWPLAAGAQQGERVRRVGVLMNLAAEDPEAQTRLAAFHQGLQEAGWAVGRNLNPVGCGRCRPLSHICAGVGRSCTGCHSGNFRLDGAVVATGDPQRADRVHADP